MLAAAREQFVSRGEGMWRCGSRASTLRLPLVAAHDEAAAHRVVLLLAQHFPGRIQGGETHAVGMARKLLVPHEEQLHRLIEGDLVLAQQTNAAALADARDA